MIYEYHCLNCNNVFEVMHKVDEKVYPECPSCGGVDCEKWISTSTFRLRGDGWYDPSAM